MADGEKPQKRRKSVKKSIVKFFKGSSKTKGLSLSDVEDKVEVKDIGESSEATEMVDESAPAPAIAEPAAEPAAEEEKEEEPVQRTQSKENAKKILFAASVIGVAAKVLAGKGKGLGRKKATVPAEPEFTTYCYGEGVAKKTGLPLVCFRLPKKIVVQFKNKELKLDLPSLYFKKY